MLIYIFLLIVVFLLLLPMILISFVRSILSVFGFNFMKKNKRKSETRKNDVLHSEYEMRGAGTSKQSRKKIFDKDDGEYVDFEEIK